MENRFFWRYWLSVLCIPKWCDKTKNDNFLCKMFWLREQWSSNIAVYCHLTNHSNIQSENTRFETLWFSPLTRISINVSKSSLLRLLLLTSLKFCQALLLLTCVVATKIWSCESDPWYRIHMLAFVTPNFLPICLIIVAASAIFQALIWVGVVIGKILIDLGFRNISDTKITWSWNVLVSVCLFSCITIVDWML